MSRLITSSRFSRPPGVMVWLPLAIVALDFPINVFFTIVFTASESLRRLYEVYVPIICIEDVKLQKFIPEVDVKTMNKDPLSRNTYM